MRYLFVGGTHDGEWHDVPGISDDAYNIPRQSWTLAATPELRLPCSPIEGIPELMLTHETYFRQQWNAEKNDKVYLFAFDCLKPRMVLDMLFRNYNPPVSDRRSLAVKEGRRE